MLEDIIGFFKLSKLKVMGRQFFQWQFAETAGFQQHAGGVGIDQTGGDGQVLDPELVQFKVDGFAMHTHVGNMATLFTTCWQIFQVEVPHTASMAQSTPRPPVSSKIFAMASLFSRVDDMGSPYSLGKFQSVIICIHHNNIGR